MGEPCAGQDKLNVFCNLVVNPALVCEDENLGAEPPTGSVGRNIWSTCYLYEGTGDPWAGQDRLNGLLDASFRLELVSLPENFGVDPPTGSIMQKMITKTI